MASEVPEHLLGYWSGRRWLDMSRYVVHFTDSEAAFISILREGILRPGGPYGWGKNVTEVRDGHISACLSEVPINHIQRLMDRHGSWGIGFKKPFGRDAGGSRVWYVDDDTALHKALFDAVGALMHAQDFDSPWWRVTPFIDLVSPRRAYEFEWEREWRVPGGLPFSYTDVAFVWPDARAQEMVEDIFVGYDPAWTPSELYYENGYIWLSTQWSTGDAIDDVFPRLEANLRASLISVLEEVTNEWVCLRELHE